MEREFQLAPPSAQTANTGQNRPRDPLDRYYTPKPLARALTALLDVKRGDRVLEPSAGGGAFVEALAGRGCRVTSLDVDPGAPALHMGEHAQVCDFLEYPGSSMGFAWVVGNPPYRDAGAHVRRALRLAPRVAFLLRLAFLESAERLPLWRAYPARHVYVLARRPSFTSGGTDSAAYGFFVWDLNHTGPTTLEVWADETGQAELFGGERG